VNMQNPQNYIVKRITLLMEDVKQFMI